MGKMSGGRLHDPEVVEPGDITRLIASLEYGGTPGGHEMALTLAWGINLGRFGSDAGWLLEATRAIGSAGTAYARGELADKHILQAGGEHQTGFQHPHVVSRVGVWTTGHEQRLAQGRGGRFLRSAVTSRSTTLPPTCTSRTAIRRRSTCSRDGARACSRARSRRGVEALL